MENTTKILYALAGVLLAATGALQLTAIVPAENTVLLVRQAAPIEQVKPPILWPHHGYL